MNFIELIALLIIITAVITVATLLINRKPVLNINSDDDIIKLVEDGEHLTAIKAYRQLHKTNLKTAKHFVETIKDEKNNG